MNGISTDQYQGCHPEKSQMIFLSAKKPQAPTAYGLCKKMGMMKNAGLIIYAIHNKLIE
jgi:hypothetical protein